MTVLVTGGEGFLGHNIVHTLVRRGKPVRAMVHNETKARLRLGDVMDKIEVVKGDVRDRDGLKPLMEGIDTVIHLVAIPMERDGRTYEAINYQGTVNVVDAAAAKGVPRFVNMAQNGASPDHFSRFLRSKGKADVYVQASGLDWTTLRPSVVFGRVDEFFNAMARLVRLTPAIFPMIGGGKSEFQPVAVEDVAEVVARCLDDDGTIGKTFDLGGPEVLNLGEIERRVIAAMGTRRVFFPAPVSLLRPAVWVMEKTLPGTPVLCPPDPPVPPGPPAPPVLLALSCSSALVSRSFDSCFRRAAVFCRSARWLPFQSERKCSASWPFQAGVLLIWPLSCVDCCSSRSAVLLNCRASVRSWSTSAPHKFPATRHPPIF